MGQQYFAENLRALLKTNGLSQKTVASAVDVSQQTLTNWVNGKSVPKSQGIIEALCAVLHTDQQGLFGYSDGYASAERALGHPIVGSPSPAFLPFLGAAHAGDPTDPMTIEGNMVEVPKSVADAHPMGRVLRVEGDCMDRVYPEGCIIVVDPMTEPRNGSIACVRFETGDYMMRRMYRTAGTLLLAPDSTNPEHEDMIFKGDDAAQVELVGTVVWFQAAEEMG